jgi:hypothetical protein
VSAATELFTRFLRGPASPFVAAARTRGVPASVARKLERAAGQVSPEEPQKVLESRELFESAAIRAVLADGGNLELSFGGADRIASAVEKLGLARTTDVPDPFRRVWVSKDSVRRRGVVLTHGRDELALILPHARERIGPGCFVRLSYRGFTSAVEYELQVSDEVLLPGGLVLHLTRKSGAGSIGRSHHRFAVHFKAEVRALAGDGQDAVIPCEVLDISLGGLRLEGPVSFSPGEHVRVDVPLRDGTDEPLRTVGEVRWTREASPARRSLGLEFTGLDEANAKRLARFLKGQGDVAGL